jgi:hypothetical protein
MLSAVEFEQIYSGMIAGRVPNHQGDVNLTIFYIARSVLGTDRMHLLTSPSRDGQHAYYFAAASSAFASTGDFETPLAAAFPSHPAHQGDGVYLLSAGSLSAAIIKENEKFRLLTNSTDALEAMIYDTGLPLHNVTDAQPVLMESVTGYYRRAADDLSRKAIKVSAIVVALAFTIGTASLLANSIFTGKIKSSTQKIAADLNSLVLKIDHASPLSYQLAQVQRISATVVKAGGWIDAYDASAKGEKFTVTLPSWVTQDFIAALGPGAAADIDNANNMIKVEKK